MAYGDIHNKTGTICKAQSDATCPLSTDGGHSRNADEYIDMVSARDGLDAERIREIVREGNSPKDALSIVKDSIDSELPRSKRPSALRSNPGLLNFRKTEERFDLASAEPGDRYYDDDGDVFVVIAVKRGAYADLTMLNSDGSAALLPSGRPVPNVLVDTDPKSSGSMKLARPMRSERGMGGPAASKAIRDLPRKGRLAKAAVGSTSYTDERGNPKSIQLVAQGKRLTDEKRLKFGRALWAAAGYDVAEYDSRLSFDNLTWTNRRLVERENFSWKTEKDGTIHYGESGRPTSSTYGQSELKAVEL